MLFLKINALRYPESATLRSTPSNYQKQRPPERLLAAKREENIA